MKLIEKIAIEAAKKEQDKMLETLTKSNEGEIIGMSASYHNGFIEGFYAAKKMATSCLMDHYYKPGHTSGNILIKWTVEYDMRNLGEEEVE